MVDYKHPDLGTRAVWSGESEYPAWVAAPSRAVRAFEEKIASLEGAPAALGFGTGEAAVAVTLLALLEPGDTLVSVQGPWGPVPAPLLGYLGRIGVRVELCRTAGTEDLIRKIVLGCKAVYLESPTTPELRVLDLALLSKAARKAGALVVADNTLATPVNQTPLGLGADLVIHSGVRLLSGQAGSLGGAVCGPPGLITKISGQREIMGAVLHPKEAPPAARGDENPPPQGGPAEPFGPGPGPLAGGSGSGGEGLLSRAARRSGTRAGRGPDAGLWRPSCFYAERRTRGRATLAGKAALRSAQEDHGGGGNRRRQSQPRPSPGGGRSGSTPGPGLLLGGHRRCRGSAGRPGRGPGRNGSGRGEKPSGSDGRPAPDQKPPLRSFMPFWADSRLRRRLPPLIPSLPG